MTAASDLDAVQRVVGAALASLEASRLRIDDLNVYPVPDGDTGTNLTMTVRAVADAVEESSASDRKSLARDVARGALMGARGNSGVIFSQIVRGAADVLAETTNGVEPAVAARALRGATDAAYRAVRRPVEGTMLSVIRELAEEAESRSNNGSPLGDLRVDRGRAGGLAEHVGGSAHDLREDHARVAARAHQRAARDVARERLPARRRGLVDGLGNRAHRHRQVRAGVAVRNRIDVEVVDAPAARLERRERGADDLLERLEIAVEGAVLVHGDRRTSSICTSTLRTGSPVSRPTS